MSDTSPDRITGPRFSLKALLVLVTFLALAVGLVTQYRTNRTIESEQSRLVEELERQVAENRRLRDKAGELTIDDVSAVHAIRARHDTNDYMEWAWRVWIPEGHQYDVHIANRQIPKEGLPEQYRTLPLRTPGEYLLRYQIRFDPRLGRRAGRLSTTNGAIRELEQPWMEWTETMSQTRGVEAKTSVFPRDQIELIRHRVSEPPGTTIVHARDPSGLQQMNIPPGAIVLTGDDDGMADPAEGFMIWLERIEEEASTDSP